MGNKNTFFPYCRTSATPVRDDTGHHYIKLSKCCQNITFPIMLRIKKDVLHIKQNTFFSCLSFVKTHAVELINSFRFHSNAGSEFNGQF